MPPLPDILLSLLIGRHDICHKQHLCKIISTRVKFNFLNVLLEDFMYIYVSFSFLVIFSHLPNRSEPACSELWHYSNSMIRNARLSYKGIKHVLIYVFFGG